MMPDGLRLLGVVLCGGKSRRMGQEKASLRTARGETFLECACRRLAAVCETVCLSVSSPRETSWNQIADPQESYGPISGVLSSLRFAQRNGFDACVFNPVDTPALTADDIRSLIARYRSQPRRIVCAINDDDPIQIEPLIAIYPVGFLNEIDRCVRRQRYSLRRFLGDQEVAQVRLPSHRCKNINTPDDLPSLNTD